MTLNLLQPLCTVEDYLEEEQSAEERHEYIAGRIYEMAGATEKHEIVAGNLFVLLFTHLRGSGCRTFKGDMKVHLTLNGKDYLYYPDIMVVCDPEDNEPIYKKSPKVLIEVMSDYKADHVEKLFAYQQIDTLQEYLVIDQDPENQQAWLYRAETGWQQEDGAPGGIVRVDCLDFETSLADLYQMG